MVSEQVEAATDNLDASSSGSSTKVHHNHQICNGQADICRICFCGVSTESLLAPCKCKGSLAKVHKTCLETWLGNQAIDQCEICKYQYMTARRPKGFHEWLMNSSTREDKQNLIGDMVALLLLTPLVVFSLWLCTEGAIQFSHEGFPTWESAGLIFITIVLFVVFCVWVTLLYRYHYTIWKQWRSHNFHVNLLVKSNALPVHEEVSLPPTTLQNPEAPSQRDLEDIPSCNEKLMDILEQPESAIHETVVYHCLSVVVEEVPNGDAADVPVEQTAESPTSPAKGSPPECTSSTLIIYTTSV